MPAQRMRGVVRRAEAALGGRSHAGSASGNGAVGAADGSLVVGVVPVTGMLDLKALAAAVGGKRAAMADPALAERRTGYVVGGISPVGQRTTSPTVLDETAQLWETVYVSGGRRGFDIELAPADLVAITGATLAGIAVQRG